MRILGADSFVGGTTTSISAIPVNVLKHHDLCIVKIKNGDPDYIPAVYFLEYITNDGNPENIPHVVIPLDNLDGGDDGGRWKLKDIFVSNIHSSSIYTNSIISEFPNTPITIGDSFTITENGITVEGQITINSTLTEPPLIVNSSVMVDNLNAEFINGEDVSSFIKNYNFDVAIPNGEMEMDVYFPYDVVSPPHYTAFVDICNTVDSNPSIYSWIIVRKEQDYFTIRFSGIIDSANYTLHYMVIGGMSSIYIPPTSPEAGTGGVTWNNISSDIMAILGYGYFVNTANNPVTVEMPTDMVVGSRVEIVDHYRTFSTNNCIIDRNGQKIMGMAENFVCDVDGTNMVLVYSGLTYGWSIVDYTIK